jgi:hypothetical protein
VTEIRVKVVGILSDQICQFEVNCDSRQRICDAVSVTLLAFIKGSGK